MSDTPLSIQEEEFKRVRLITVVGRVDSSNASQLDDKLKALIEGGSHNLVLELSQVNYMSSAGLRAIVAALRECKKHSGDVRLAMVSARVAEVLDLAGLHSLFQMYPDTTSAVGSF